MQTKLIPYRYFLGLQGFQGKICVNGGSHPDHLESHRLSACHDFFGTWDSIWEQYMHLGIIAAAGQNQRDDFIFRVMVVLICHITFGRSIPDRNTDGVVTLLEAHYYTLANAFSAFACLMMPPM